MTTNTSYIAPCELDFDLIKQSIIDYLSSQSEFQGYNFEGSSLNVLMDILANNTHQNAFMANMMSNEMFLDSGSIRQSVVSKAKEIGYTPRSVRSSKSTINISVPDGSGQSIIMDAGTTFATDFDYTFSTKEEYTLYPSDVDPTTYTADGVDIYDGNYVEFGYVVNTETFNQQFTIPSVDVDMSSLRVFVKPTKASSTIEEYFLSDDVNRLKSDSKVFFIHETPEGYFEVTFGDGILGSKPINENYVNLTYIVAKGKASANNITVFNPVVRIGGYTGYTITTVEPSYGGSEKESLEDIKFLAPLMYQSQRRAVTTQDYETFLYHDYPWIDSMNIWGGEFNDPPIYGKIFFAIKPKHTEVLSNKLKEQIKTDIIKKYNVVTIVPEIIDPDYIYVNVDTDVYYSRSKTVISASQLASMTSSIIYTFFNDTTKKFKMDFRLSQMATKIDNTESSFDSSLSNIIIHKRIYPIVNAQQTFELKFNNAILPNTIETSYYDTEDVNVYGIKIETVIKDNGAGKMQVIQVSNGVVINANAGIVNYDTGTISITLFPYSLPLDTLDVRVYATPKNKNIISGYNQIILPDDTPINIDVNRKQGVTVRVNAIDVKRG